MKNILLIILFWLFCTVNAVSGLLLIWYLGWIGVALWLSTALSVMVAMSIQYYRYGREDHE